LHSASRRPVSTVSACRALSSPGPAPRHCSRRPTCCATGDCAGIAAARRASVRRRSRSPIPAKTSSRTRVLKALALMAALLGGCAGIPDRLDAFADAGREFAVVHPALTGAALIDAPAALRKPQHLRVMCNPHSRLGSTPPPLAWVSAALPP